MRKLALAFLLLATPVFAGRPHAHARRSRGGAGGPRFRRRAARRRRGWTRCRPSSAREVERVLRGRVRAAMRSDFLYGLGVAALFLLTPLARRMRARPRASFAGRSCAASSYAAQYVLFLTVFQFPMSWYRGLPARARLRDGQQLLRLMARGRGEGSLRSTSCWAACSSASST